MPLPTPPDTQDAMGRPLFARPSVEKPKKLPDSPAQKSEARLLEMIDETDVFLRLMEAAEASAAIGGVYIYPAWDKDLADAPFVAVAQADMAVPVFRHGFLVSVSSTASSTRTRTRSGVTWSRTRPRGRASPARRSSTTPSTRAPR
jgi:hypothetical protein